MKKYLLSSLFLLLISTGSSQTVVAWYAKVNISDLDDYNAHMEKYWLPVADKHVENGNLIGINSSGIRKDIADNVAYSIKTSYILNLIDILPKSIELPSNTKLESLPLTEQIKEISKYVVLIKVK